MEQGNGPLVEPYHLEAIEADPLPVWMSGPGRSQQNKAMSESQQLAEIEALIRFQEENPDYWGDQDENGVDLARLRENLKLTPAERIRRNSIALSAVLQVEQARERIRTARRQA